MSIDANKQIVGRFFEEVFNRQNQATAAEIIDPALVVHHPLLPGGRGGVQEVDQMMRDFRGGFPDLAYTVEDLVAEDAKVAARWTARGTHTGVFQGIAPTGRAVVVDGTDVFRIAADRIAETWVSSDLCGLLRQIGALG
jgi:steroid delta-isomerase-like uncharacterized protein